MRTLALLPLDDLESARTNPKTHDLDSLGASLERFGYIEPIVRDDRTGRLVGGHGRTESIRAARDAGQDPPEGVEVDDEGNWLVPVVTGWASKDDDEADAAVIALNRVGEKGGWDKEALVEMLANLTTTSNLKGVGFSEGDLDDLIAECSRNQTEAFSTDRHGTGAARSDSSLEEREERYREKETRAFVLDYDLEEYEVIQRRAAAAREELGVGTTAEVFEALVRQWGEEHP